MKNMNGSARVGHPGHPGGHPSGGGGLLSSGSYHSVQHHDLVNGNYSTTINVAHNRNGNGGGLRQPGQGATGGRGEMNGGGGGGTWRDSQNFEIPLPFGYHMDLDFVRFCSEDTMITEETLDRFVSPDRS